MKLRGRIGVTLAYSVVSFCALSVAGAQITPRIPSGELAAPRMLEVQEDNWLAGWLTEMSPQEEWDFLIQVPIRLEAIPAEVTKGLVTCALFGYEAEIAAAGGEPLDLIWYLAPPAPSVVALAVGVREFDIDPETGSFRGASPVRIEKPPGIPPQLARYYDCKLRLRVQSLSGHTWRLVCSWMSEEAAAREGTACRRETGLQPLPSQ